MKRIYKWNHQSGELEEYTRQRKEDFTSTDHKLTEDGTDVFICVDDVARSVCQIGPKGEDLDSIDTNQFFIEFPETLTADPVPRKPLSARVARSPESKIQ